MSDNLKNNEYLNELIRYKSNKMSNQERHLFERALERDPFLAEALEGFSEFKSTDIEKDLASIDLISGKRRFRLNPMVFYVAAACVVIGLFTFFLINYLGNEQEFVAKKYIKPEQKLDFNDTSYKETKASTTTRDTFAIMLAEVNKVPSGETENAQNQPANNKGQENALTKAPSKNTTDKKVNAKQPATMAAVQASEDVDSGANKIEPALAKSESDSESGSNSTNAENNISDSNKKVEAQPLNKRVGVNAKSEPLGGFDLFKNYIDNNAKYPSSETDGSREVVKIQFTVNTNGQLSNFSTDKAPENADFTNEAIRLLKNGPKWAPAVKDGIPVEEVVNYRIIFKSSSK